MEEQCGPQQQLEPPPPAEHAAVSPPSTTQPPTCLQALARLPPPTGGLALGLTGLAAVWGQVPRLWAASVGGDSPSWVLQVAENVEISALIASALLILSYIAKALFCFPTLVKELQNPATGALAVHLMTLSSLGGTVAKRIDKNLGSVIVSSALALQVVVIVHFLTLVYRKGERLQPQWFPPTIGIAITAGSGYACGFPQELLIAILCVGAFFMLVMVPVSNYRIAVDPDEVTNPTVAILCAPSPLLLSMWNVIERPGPAWIGAALWIKSTVDFLQVLQALYVRRQSWAKSFTPLLAALTFSCQSTAFAHVLSFLFFDLNIVVIRIWVWFLVAMSTTVVLSVLLGFMIHLPSWLKAPPPTAAESPSQAPAVEPKAEEAELVHIPGPVAPDPGDATGSATASS